MYSTQPPPGGGGWVVGRPGLFTTSARRVVPCPSTTRALLPKNPFTSTMSDPTSNTHELATFPSSRVDSLSRWWTSVRDCLIPKEPRYARELVPAGLSNSTHPRALSPGLPPLTEAMGVTDEHCSLSIAPQKRTIVRSLSAFCPLRRPCLHPVPTHSDSTMLLAKPDHLSPLVKVATGRAE